MSKPMSMHHVGVVAASRALLVVGLELLPETLHPPPPVEIPERAHHLAAPPSRAPQEPGPPDERESGHESPEVRDVSDTVRANERAHERDEAPDDNHVSSLYGECHQDPDLVVREQDPIGEQDSVDRPRGAEDRNAVERSVGNEGHEGRPQTAEDVVADEELRPPGPLDRASEDEEGKHVEQQAKHVPVKEHVGPHTPDLKARGKDCGRRKPEPARQGRDQYLKEERDPVRDDDGLDARGEGPSEAVADLAPIGVRHGISQLSTRLTAPTDGGSRPRWPRDATSAKRREAPFDPRLLRLRRESSRASPVEIGFGGPPIPQQAPGTGERRSSSRCRPRPSLREAPAPVPAEAFGRRLARSPARGKRTDPGFRGVASEARPRPRERALPPLRIGPHD